MRRHDVLIRVCVQCVPVQCLCVGTGALDDCGEGDGLGFTVNVPWDSVQQRPNPTGDGCEELFVAMSDAEYLAAFRAVVMPVLRDYEPDLVLVSCGFDAAVGHPRAIGGYFVSPQCYAYLVRQLMQVRVRAPLPLLQRSRSCTRKHCDLLLREARPALCLFRVFTALAPTLF